MRRAVWLKAVERRAVWLKAVERHVRWVVGSGCGGGNERLRE